MNIITQTAYDDEHFERLYRYAEIERDLDLVEAELESARYRTLSTDYSRQKVWLNTLRQENLAYLHGKPDFLLHGDE